MIPTPVYNRCVEALRSPALSPCSAMVLTRMLRLPRQAVGRSGAISIRDLQTWAASNNHPSFSARDIKSAVKQLIEDFKVPIGSARFEPCGYFVIASAEDLAEALKPLRHECDSLSERIDCLAAAFRVQGEMEFQEGAA